MLGHFNSEACFENVSVKKVQHAKDVALNFEQGCYKLHAWLCLSLLEDHPLYNINTFDAFEHLPFLMKLDICLKFSKV